MSDISPARKRIAIIQSAYIPWRGFFDLIARCDEYVILDGAQYAKRHWHNRNKIVTPNGPLWLTIPVATKSRFEQPINEVEINEPWAEKHWRSFASNYKRAAHARELLPRLERLFVSAGTMSLLTDVNEIFLREVAALLNIKTAVTRDTQYTPTGSKTGRLLDICIKAGATHYVSGPSARDYLDESLFREAGISVEWMSYPTYPTYAQAWPGFEPAVTVFDLLLNAGTDCPALWNSVS